MIERACHDNHLWMTRNRSRLLTLEALALLPLARLLVDRVPLKFWRGSLGAIVSKDLLGNPATGREADRRLPSALARRVERAAAIVPFHTKCLPRAVTLHWMLRRRGIAALLVIARRRGENPSPDFYHAWVETGGDMLIGHCERSLYIPLMVITNKAAPGALRAER
ncbi:lasso peptide biosynthesis B2 protein [Croceicoccus marinus]|nr:lasso peptide biosynthesis B2 protein [Croceicoccus marinus]